MKKLTRSEKVEYINEVILPKCQKLHDNIEGFDGKEEGTGKENNQLFTISPFDLDISIDIIGEANLSLEVFNRIFGEFKGFETHADTILKEMGDE